MRLLKIFGITPVSVIIFGFSFLSEEENQKPDSTKVENKQKPNIVFFIADDMERYMFNCLPEGKDKKSNNKNLSPNIDRLANEGIVLMGQHTSSSVCTPSRYSCLTGEYASRSTSKKLTHFTKKMDGQTVVQWNSYITPDKKCTKTTRFMLP